jgi:cytidylyltransferase-like protein
LINDLERHLKSTPGPIAILTGTFDPSHIGHVAALRDASMECPDIQSAIVLPHNWNGAKNPVMALGDRIRGAELTFGEFGGDIDFPVVVSADPSLSCNVEEFEAVTSLFRDRLIRVFGNDEKDWEKILGATGWKVAAGERQEGLSSTAIKERLSMGAALSELRGVVHKLVLHQLAAYLTKW